VNLEENEAADFHVGANLSLIHPSQKKVKKDLSKKSTPYFWNDENDECIIVAGGESINCNNKDNTGGKSLKFTIRGKPLPLVRHRSSRGFMYNPSGAAQEMFRDSLLRMLPQRHHPIIIDDGSSLDNPVTFFSKSEFLEMSIVFRLKRPKSHFVGSKPGPGRIKSDAPGKFHVSRTDIDNLAKFVLDSLNGILYEDDRQVVSLKAIKMLDSEGMCGGATDVTITVLEDERVNST
jgi:Holliday junction resolvase RusA-like endonuclease